MKPVDARSERKYGADKKTANESHGDSKGDKAGEAFPRLSLEMCDGDDGTRPPSADWPGAGVWWSSPAIGFDRPEPFPVGQPMAISVTVRNLGTADAAGAWIEAAYNIWLGNDPQGMVTLGTANLPVIAAGEAVIASIPWTPPDADSTHACVHVRALDIYSMLHHWQQVQSWYSFENPQAANRNVRLALIEDDAQPIVMTYKARNPGKRPLKARVLVTRVDRARRRVDAGERFPLPFAAALSARGRIGVGSSALARRALSPGTVHRRFDHARFGFSTRTAPTGKGTSERTHAVRSLRELTLEPGEVRNLQLVLPAKEFPAPGHDAWFQIDYQVGDGVPVQHFVRLAR